MSKSQFEMVKEFHQTFGHPVAEVPTALAQGDKDAEVNCWDATEKSLKLMKDYAKVGKLGPQFFRVRLMLEELVEFMEADDLVGQTDAMLDLLYFANGTIVEMGVDPEKPFQMVHAANMRKLWPDGKPRWNAEGKIMKPEGWVGPEEELKGYIESLEVQK